MKYVKQITGIAEHVNNLVFTKMKTEKWFFMRYLLKVLSGDFIFIPQSLTTSKMRKKQTKKLSQLHKAKTCGLVGL